MDRQSLRLVPTTVSKFKGKNYPRDTTSRYALLNADGSVDWDMPNYCHAGLKRGTGDPVAVINQVQEFRAGEDVATRFLEWLLNYSPYRSVFTTKRVKRVLEDRVVIADTEVEANLMVSALMSQRACTEDHCGNQNYSIANTWDRLVSLGVHPNAAFAISHRFRPSKDLTTISLYERSHHTGMGRDNVTFWNFYEGIVGNNIGSYRETKTYSGIDNVWKTARKKKSPIIDVNSAFQRTIGVKKGGNPFDVQAGPASFPYNEALEEVALTVKNTLKEYALAA